MTGRRVRPTGRLFGAAATAVAATTLSLCCVGPVAADTTGPEAGEAVADEPTASQPEGDGQGFEVWTPRGKVPCTITGPDLNDLRDLLLSDDPVSASALRDRVKRPTLLCGATPAPPVAPAPGPQEEPALETPVDPVPAPGAGPG